MILESRTIALEKKGISDTFGRTFKTLRVSLTNTCNLACTYCVDPNLKTNPKATASSLNQQADKNKQVLSNEQYVKIIHSLHQILALDTIRLTGGEPLLYREISSLIKGVKGLGVSEIKMTSNATLLAAKAEALYTSGLTSINISLDAIDADVSFTINQRDKINKILLGIDKAIDAGIKVKINSVIIKGVNESQIIRLLEYGMKKNIPVRFLELMQMGHLYHNFEEHFFPEAEILKIIANLYPIKPVDRKPNATANYWSTGPAYQFGIISNVSKPFCNDCNRLRLDSYGNIYGCLSDNHPINVMDCIDNEEEMRERLILAMAQKKTKFSGSALSMLHIGG